MKTVIISTIILIVSSFQLLPDSTITLKTDGDFIDILADNNVYIKRIRDIDHEGNYLYLLDSKIARVFKVDGTTGKLVKTLFRRGQGPLELMTPVSFRIKNNKAFVLDAGYNGVKIAGLDGKFIDEFKIKGNVYGKRNLDVNHKDEIFVAEYLSSKGTYVSVYDMKGNFLRSFVKLGGQKPGQPLPLKRIHYRVAVDNEGCVLLLFLISKELKKFDTNGNLQWELKISNKILDKFTGNEQATSNAKVIKTRYHLFDLNITGLNNIIVGHSGGGCVYDTKGNLIHLILFDTGFNLATFDRIGDTLFNVLGLGRTIHTYRLREKL